MDNPVKKLREKYSLTQEEFGRIIGVKRSTVCSYENKCDLRRPKLQTCERLEDLSKRIGLDYRAVDFMRKAC